MTDEVILVESADFRLTQQKTYYERAIKDGRVIDAGCKLYFKDKLVAESGCGCCGYDLNVPEAIDMLLSLDGKIAENITLIQFSEPKDSVSFPGRDYAYRALSEKQN